MIILFICVRSVQLGLSRVMIGVMHLLLYLYGSKFIPDDYLLSAEFDVSFTI